MEDLYATFDKPYPYKDILLYPVTMEHYFEFMHCVNCLLIEKNNTNDINIIKMSYLQYLIYLSEQSEDNQVIVEMLYYLFELILKNQKVVFYKGYGETQPYFEVEGVKYLSQDFDEIKKIILEQHCIPNEELLLDPKIAEAVKSAEEYQRKHSKEFADLEEQMITYHLYNGYDYEKIYKLTIRKFRKAIDRMQLIENYRISKSAELSGMVTFKEDIEYFLSHIKPKGKLDGVVVKDSDKTIDSLKQSLQ